GPVALGRAVNADERGGAGRGRVDGLVQGRRGAGLEVGIAAVGGGDGVATRGREGGREPRRAVGADRDGLQDDVAVLEGDRAGRGAGPRGAGGHRGGEGHRLAGDGRVDRRPQRHRGRRGIDGHGRGRRGAAGEVAVAREGGRQLVVADAQRHGEGGL